MMPPLHPDTLAALDALLRQPDPADLLGRGHRQTLRGLPALKERTFARAVAAYLAARRGLEAPTRAAVPVRRLRVVGR